MPSDWTMVPDPQRTRIEELERERDEWKSRCEAFNVALRDHLNEIAAEVAPALKEELDAARARVTQLEEALHNCAGEREMRDAALEDAYRFIREQGEWDAFMEAINRPTNPDAKGHHPEKGES
jgi:chromosome segregation ATPase